MLAALKPKTEALDIIEEYLRLKEEPIEVHPVTGA